MAANRQSKAELAKYVSSLPLNARLRYAEKIAKFGGVDPYNLEKMSYVKDVTILPKVEHVDIVNYLVLSTSSVTREQMKAYKSLQSYNYFLSGWVQEILSTVLENRKVLLLGKVNHSMRAREPPLRPWIVCEEDGLVVTAHCTCMAGLGETCSHIGALLFAVDATVRVRESQTCTTQPCQWVLPASMKEVPFVEVREISFSSAKQRKRVFDETLSTPSALKRKPVDTRSDIEPSQSQIDAFFRQVNISSPHAAVLAVHPEFQSTFIPKNSNLPCVLSSFYDPSTSEMSFEELNAFCSTVEMSLTTEMAENVESATREQAASKEWFKYRTGRITASRMKAVCHTSLEKPSLSLIKTICYPYQHRFQTTATRWGCEHEEVARSLYCQYMRGKHSGFQLKESGLVLHTEYPHLGASPDGNVTCDCCGRGVCEIKCPFCLRDQNLEDQLPSKSCLENRDGQLTLDRKHAYFYQVQTQIFICGADYCDFIVWTKNSFSVERILPNQDFWDYVVDRSTDFFKIGILPELVGTWYTKKSAICEPADEIQNDVEEEWCFCRKGEDGTMIACDYDDCKIQWFHMDCLRIARKPKGKWFCQPCQKLLSTHNKK